MLRDKRPHAFTLIEVLVVVAIIALLVAILLPSLGRAREQSRILVCKTRLNELYKGHVFYSHDNKGHFPDSDWWLWDGIGGEMRQWFPQLYAKFGGSRPTDSGRWVELGHIYKYIKDKETYFCPKDTKRRQGSSIGAGGGLGNKPIHSFVRFWEPRTFYHDHTGGDAANRIPNGSLPALYRSDFIGPDHLRYGVFTPPRRNPASKGGGPWNSVPSRVGLMFEEFQNYGEPPLGSMPNKEAALNDGYSGFLVFTDWPSYRHLFQSNVLFWDGSVKLIDSKKFFEDVQGNPNRNPSVVGYAAWSVMGAAKP